MNLMEVLKDGNTSGGAEFDAYVESLSTEFEQGVAVGIATFFFVAGKAGMLGEALFSMVGEPFTAKNLLEALAQTDLNSAVASAAKEYAKSK